MKRINTLFFMLLLAFALFANGSKESTITTVELWHSNSGKIGEAFEEIIEDFNSGLGKEKGIYIDAIYQGKANDVLTKVKASAGANTLPDLAQMDATSGMDMNNSSYIVTMDELGIDTSNILDIALSGFKSNRGLIAMPFNASAMLLYYNNDVFKALGLNPPSSIDDMIALAPRLKEKTQYAFSGVPATSELTTLLGAQNGLEYLVNNENGHISSATKVLFGDNGTYRNFLDKWKELYATGCVNNITQGVSTEFAAGRSAMIFASSSNLSTIISTVGDSFEVNVAPLPIVDEKATGGVSVGGGAIYAFKNSNEVKSVIEYLLSEDVQLKWAKATGYIPLNTALYSSKEYKEFIEENPNFAIAMDAILSSNPKLTNVWLPSAYQIYYAFQKNIADVITGAINIDDGVMEMVDFVQSALDSNEG